MSRASKGRGNLWAEYTYSACCLDCREYRDIDEAEVRPNGFAGAIRLLRRLGWSKTKRGWICGECKAKRKAKRDQRRSDGLVQTDLFGGAM